MFNNYTRLGVFLKAYIKRITPVNYNKKYLIMVNFNLFGMFFAYIKDTIHVKLFEGKILKGVR